MTPITHVQDLNRSIIGDLSLPSLLRRIVEAARDLVGADYAGLGVIGADGGMQQFIHAGMNAATVASIGGPRVAVACSCAA